MNKSRRFFGSVATVVAGISVLSLSPVVSADELDTLLASMEEVSQQANAKNEEVKQLEIDLENQGKELEVLEQEVKDASALVDQAKSQEDQYKEQINRISGTKYKGTLVDPITNAISSDDPQQAIDRAAYLSTLSKKTQGLLGELSDSTRQAAKARNDKSRALAEAKHKRHDIEQKHKLLLKEREELEEQTNELAAQVDGLSEQDRTRWIEKNEPVLDFVAQEFSIPSGGSETAKAAVAAAMSKQGAPYSWGAIGPDAFDCSGLIYWSYQQAGLTVPRTSQAQMAAGTPVSREELQPGDVVGYYPGATHVGMYIGDGMLIHASDYGIPVQVVSVDSMPWYGARRF
ncbi:hydrolase [Corynebacterium sp. sy017]|uniref:NlpC/P60 family protein n=1 Tax=unclassified Corynebacterium TaxID=2624378 RepID=UPI001186FC5E|nr:MULTISPECIES: NlpC/P60 family protein [unclassified Corynebacterium]MBP3087985.1 hydrolase [Corynebacterium sp. sy017]TSD92515.1 hydrolase [Corynebacterium sp. SY003]